MSTKRISGRSGSSESSAVEEPEDPKAVDAVAMIGRPPGLAVDRRELAERDGTAPERTDRDLVREARKGSHAAFETLVRRHAERAFRVAYRVLRDAEQAEEVLQEALIKAYQGLPQFESRSSFYTWLYRITMNLALDRRRRAKRLPAVEWNEGVAHEVDPRHVSPVVSSPEVDSRRHQVRELVAEGIRGLPDSQREVLLLREVDGLSYEEIADTMQISKGTVMSRLHYARKKMMAFLKSQGVEPEDVV